jgi:hypothetical protein
MGVAGKCLPVIGGCPIVVTCREGKLDRLQAPVETLKDICLRRPLLVYTYYKSMPKRLYL